MLTLLSFWVTSLAPKMAAALLTAIQSLTLVVAAWRMLLPLVTVGISNLAV